MNDAANHERRPRTRWDAVVASRRAAGLPLVGIAPLSIYRCLACGTIPDEGILGRLRATPMTMVGHQRVHRLTEICQCGVEMTRELLVGANIIDDIHPLNEAP